MGSSPIPLTKSINIALSSEYWIFGIIIANLISIAMTKSWESLSESIKEMIVMTRFTINTLLLTFAASEGLV